MLQSQDSSGWQGSLQLPPEARIKPSSKGIVVFSGGSAANSLVDVFNGVAENNASTLSYVIPISDNGGSSSELIRVFGGPGEFFCKLPGGLGDQTTDIDDRHW